MRLAVEMIGTAGGPTDSPKPDERGATRLFVFIAVALFSTAMAACSGGSPSSGVQNSARESEITVPDEISGLDSEEVDRRLTRLLGGNPTASSTQPAQIAAPTQEPSEPSIEEILALLEATDSGQAGKEIVIAISPETMSRLTDPVLTIKTPPANGTAVVLSLDQVLYVPTGNSGEGDSFEYELQDGGVSVFSQLIQIRPQSPAAN